MREVMVIQLRLCMISSTSPPRSLVNKEERDVLEKEIREQDECDSAVFVALDDSNRKVAILVDRWWPPAVKPEGDDICTIYVCNVQYVKTT